MEKTKPTSQEKQGLVDNIKHGFRPEDVVVRITPQHKKSITQMIQLYNVPVGEPGHRFVEVNETYRWGYGYKEGDDMNWPYQWRTNQHYCDPSIGHGAELDDLCSVWFDFDGNWTDEQKEDFEDKWYNGDPNDDDGRCGMGWVYDYQDTWQIEDEQLIVDGPFKYDIIDKTQYNKIYIENWQPTKEKTDAQSKEEN
jgi:hypothetical protein